MADTSCKLKWMDLQLIYPTDLSSYLDVDTSHELSNVFANWLLTGDNSDADILTWNPTDTVQN